MLQCVQWYCRPVEQEQWHSPAQQLGNREVSHRCPEVGDTPFDQLRAWTGFHRCHARCI
jgi:hypothetical protein